MSPAVPFDSIYRHGFVRLSTSPNRIRVTFDHHVGQVSSGTNMTRRYIRFFDEIGIEDVPLVGGKNASLGEMYRNLSSQGIAVPNGFAIMASARMSSRGPSIRMSSWCSSPPSSAAFGRCYAGLSGTHRFDQPQRGRHRENDT